MSKVRTKNARRSILLSLTDADMELFNQAAVIGGFFRDVAQSKPNRSAWAVDALRQLAAQMVEEADSEEDVDGQGKAETVHGTRSKRATASR